MVHINFSEEGYCSCNIESKDCRLSNARYEDENCEFCNKGWAVKHLIKYSHPTSISALGIPGDYFYAKDEWDAVEVLQLMQDKYNRMIGLKLENLTVHR